ncbi:aminotransferase [Allorhizobium taibaishanense]|uniref:Aminotransferase n=1 Tax=Allorhizobium taibaishanense TaxID=887144 RepID=A0A1Q9A3K5_9HYPH|nr:aminotransferase [Allorhizobium taibaishanense]MBB4006002.1 aspartate/methionine/tyrosine aminotransferase [Allorhizobium taibaishanense]OLP49027.1 aspartate/tyrosine/aromatic aminotransferase [Allorhizobium taibaishanense]
MSDARFNSRVATLAVPPIPAVFVWGRAYDGLAGPLIDLSQAAPGHPPHADLLAWLSAAAGSPASSGYGPIEGETALRQAYAEHASTLYGAGIVSEQVHITAGANQAFICTAMALAGAGERIALTDPFYFNHDTTLAMLGIETVALPCDSGNGFLPDLAAAERIIESGIKALALVTPNNPTGAVYPKALLSDLYRLCRRHGVWLILDETYRDFLAPGSGAPHDLFGGPDWAETLIQIYSFSKSFAIPGHRLAAITAGEAVVAQLAKIMDNLQICAPRAAQIALAKAIPVLDDWRIENAAEIARRTVALREAFAQLPDWQIDSIGAYFAFVRHPFADTPSADVAEQLAKRSGILAVPGGFFGAGQEGYLRLAFANVDCATIATLPARLQSFKIKV